MDGRIAMHQSVSILVFVFLLGLSMGTNMHIKLAELPACRSELHQCGIHGAGMLRLRGAGSTMRVLSVQEFSGWKNVSENDYNSVSTSAAGLSTAFGSSVSRSFSQFNRSMSEEQLGYVPFADHGRIIELIRQNRRLAIQVKSLRSRAIDDETKISLDQQLAQLESAWEAYIKTNPAAVGWQRTLERAELVDHDGAPVRLIPVTFRLFCNVTNVGDKVLLMGDADELGSWCESRAIVMKTDPEMFPVWSATVLMKGSECVEYKYAIGRMGERGTCDPVTGLCTFEKVDWEGHMGNRGFKVPRRAHLINETFVDIPEITDNWKSPRFLRMHRVDSSELFLEPEYAMVYD